MRMKILPRARKLQNKLYFQTPCPDLFRAPVAGQRLRPLRVLCLTFVPFVVSGSFAMTGPWRGGAAHEAGVGVSRAGLAGPRHGPGLGRGLPGRPPPVPGGRRRAVAAPLAADVRGAGKRIDAD